MHMSSLIPELASVDLKKMSLDLSHSFSHQKLDKGNTMVGRAIRLLDDLDNTLNTYSMKAREWYEWHFPETEKIVKDNLAYAQAINFMGTPWVKHRKLIRRSDRSCVHGFLDGLT